jgi:tartrate dehydratase alpha subunit/fumarate hydratase class I-like protein
MPEFSYADLRPAHLRQLRSILDDPEASGNDRFVAADLLKNACIAAGGVLPMCQDTGTAIVKGKQIEVRDFPAFIVVDDKGNDFFSGVTAPEQPLLTIGGPGR